MELKAENLVCVRGGREVFAGVGFAVRGGEALLVTGPNGAGKSSLLRLIAGLLRPAGGTIRLAAADDDLSIAEQSHYLGHQDACKPALSAAENLQFWSDYLGGGNANALAKAGLRPLAKLPAAYLSAGQRRRLSIARLIAVKRRLWLLDEPNNGLDAAGQEEFAALMTKHLEAGGIIVAATHGPLGLARGRRLSLGAKELA